MKLSGIRVLDMTTFLPGPWAAQMLADHGAEVIKIERATGEPTRRLGPELDGFPAYFRNTQRGKFGIVLDLKSDEGREVFMRLAETADVVLESYRPGVVKRLGVDYEAVHARVPNIVYCSLSAFGQTGPYAGVPSHDLGAQAMCGALELSRAGGGAPGMPGLPVADVALGTLAVAGIAMALYRRERTGIGDYIDLSMIDALLAWMPHVLSPVLAEARAPVPSRERLYGAAAFYNIYRTADDRYVVLSGAEMNFVENLLKALGRPDLIEACRQEAGPAQDLVKAFLRETFLERTRDEWNAWLKDKGVCYAPVLDLHEAWHSQAVRAREIVRRGEDGIEYVGTPLKFAREPGDAKSAVFAQGQHTEAILERLGYDADERARMKAAGVF